MPPQYSGEEQWLIPAARQLGHHNPDWLSETGASGLGFLPRKYAHAFILGSLHSFGYFGCHSFLSVRQFGTSSAASVARASWQPS
jgi:hypothetical protein